MNAKPNVVFLYLAIGIAFAGSCLLLLTWWKSHTLVSSSDAAAAFCSEAKPGMRAGAVLEAARRAGIEAPPSDTQIVADFGRCNCFVTLTPEKTVAAAVAGCAS